VKSTVLEVDDVNLVGLVGGEHGGQLVWARAEDDGGVEGFAVDHSKWVAEVFGAVFELMRQVRIRPNSCPYIVRCRTRTNITCRR
jgi:hypothetical protein